MHVARSTISLQNPVVRPSMIVRAVVVEADHRYGYVCYSSGLRLGQPDPGVLGVGEAADGVTSSGSVVVGPRTALVAATKPS